jgi:hypothetical protein
MLGRRRIETTAPLRSSLANAVFAVEERLVWGGADAARRVFDAVKWPFERIVWAIERGLVWPLQDRTGGWSGPVRAGGVATLALLAVGAGVLVLVWASGGSNGSAGLAESAAPVAAPVVRAAPAEAPPAAPVLQGVKPDFSAEADGGASGVSGSSAEAGAATGSPASANSTSEVATSGAGGAGASSSESTKVAGPAAMKVARRFSGAFVLYEIGHETAGVRSVFADTATPQVARSLLQRQPRQPAGVKVPKAKVLNVVAGPSSGSTYTLSVSLLRVGVTSELRLGLQRDPKTREWHVTEILG